MRITKLRNFSCKPHYNHEVTPVLQYYYIKLQGGSQYVCLCFDFEIVKFRSYVSHNLRGGYV